jgi:hypothetical protein
VCALTDGNRDHFLGCVAHRFMGFRLVGEIKIQIGDSIAEADSVAVSREYSLKAKNKTYSAVKVAQDALTEWKRILAQNKL